MTLPQFMEKERRRILKFYNSQQPFNRLMPGIQYFQQNRLVVRKEQYEMFLEDWQNWKNHALWDEFRSVMQRPLSMVDRIFPASGFPLTPDAQVQT
jgi:hypothetical protein